VPALQADGLSLRHFENGDAATRRGFQRPDIFQSADQAMLMVRASSPSPAHACHSPVCEAWAGALAAPLRKKCAETHENVATL
jgi:hypothetical protein